MLTLEQIRGTANINGAIAREAYDQAETRLKDVLDTKRDFEQKAFALFGGYVTVSIALFSTVGGLAHWYGITRLVIGLLVAAVIFLAGSGCFISALLIDDYGALGSDPSMWLQSGTIDGSDSVLPLMLAYITYYHKKRIDQSITANNKKAARIRNGIVLGIFAPIALGSLLFILCFIPI